MREDFEHQSVWRAHGKGWRTFVCVFLPIALIFLAATSVIDDVPWGTRIGAVCNVIAGLGFTVMTRVGTIVTAQGIRVTQFRTQQIAWGEVEELRADPPGPWAAKVQAVLAYGSVITLPAVPASDLPRLDALRAGV